MDIRIKKYEKVILRTYLSYLKSFGGCFLRYFQIMLLVYFSELVKIGCNIVSALKFNHVPDEQNDSLQMTVFENKLFNIFEANEIKQKFPLRRTNSLITTSFEKKYRPLARKNTI